MDVSICMEGGEFHCLGPLMEGAGSFAAIVGISAGSSDSCDEQARRDIDSSMATAATISLEVMVRMRLRRIVLGGSLSAPPVLRRILPSAARTRHSARLMNLPHPPPVSRAERGGKILAPPPHVRAGNQYRQRKAQQYLFERLPRGYGERVQQEEHAGDG